MTTTLPSSAAPRVCRVDASAHGANDGTSWRNAYIDLQSALTNTGCTEIWVAAGTYYPTTGSDRTATFQLQSGVAVYGGFAGDELLRWQRNANPSTNNTVLSGDVGTTGIFGDNSYHVVTTTGADESTILDGFTITAGRASAGGTQSHGAGIFNPNGSPTLANLIISHNQANGSGGGIYNAGSPTLSNVTFSNNFSGTSGGGLSNSSGSPSLTHVTFSDNFADNGGGMFNQNNVSVTMTHATFSDNSANTQGGAMFDNSVSYETLSDVTFSHNDAASGGGIYNEPGCQLTLTDVTFTGNTANLTGGGLSNGISDSILNDVTFDGNTAGHSGGAIWNYKSALSLTNVTISNSTAEQGGGMYNISANPILNTVTFRGNSASQDGGGMYDDASSSILHDVLFDSNVATGVGGGGGIYDDSSSPTLERVTFHANTAGTGAGMFNYTGSNPMLTDVVFDANIASGVGGGIYNYQSSPALTNVTFSHNGAVNDQQNSNTGGGIDNSESSSPSLTNVTFDGNSADKGGAVYNFDGSNPALINVTISGNRASIAGGGIDNEYSAPTLTNVLLWGDSAPTGPEISNDSSTPTISYSDVQGSGGSGSWDTALGTDGGNNIDADPLLGPLANNGGYTQTMALQSGSPAIDAGDDGACPSTDQRGVARPQGAACDMGAFEAVVNTSLISLAHGSGQIESAAGAYLPVPTADGSAIFNFTAYAVLGHALPTGSLQFRLAAANFSFQSHSFDRIVFDQAGTSVQLWGSGTAEGNLAPNHTPYQFTLWASDGNPDSLHIRIWWTDGNGLQHVVYDNASLEPISSGAILIHSVGGQNHAFGVLHGLFGNSVP